ncbi:hypothetical protein HanPI659440_Chr13g0523561 [Helianthus annuus]|nr:hypothetical protein HanPI659440_Chr13g0523561 [Helianthus annuus]
MQPLHLFSTEYIPLLRGLTYFTPEYCLQFGEHEHQLSETNATSEKLVNKHIMSYKVQDGAAEYKACVIVLFTSKMQQYGLFHDIILCSSYSCNSLYYDMVI